ncbi:MULTISPECIES: hypothetical protein [unclassified Paraburkholderia]|jgi:hypothetical protein|uniref:hypothetical protein n=1 Tax=unclassified Paraburkholderia TaxID=2615204 RepID=UPI0009474965|nr:MULTISPECIES: hypothetical protein [unclassified Paraburkholderia]APR34846.1 hypothetical protein BTO02_04765 [Paraburkholderia sp. SOS3]MDQ7976039.1 hypothetical protein [Paraburkholderia sp. SARCC-3016]
MTAHESLLNLAEYLDLSLNAGESVIMMQACNDACAMYVGNAARTQSLLIFHGSIAASLAEEILRRTRSGLNRMEIAGHVYRFVRRATHFEDRGAIVFAPT